jgi:hypothetical protein
VHLVKDGDDAFLVVLFEYLPQGIIIDRATANTVADVIEGDIIDVVEDFEKDRANAIWKTIPL